VPVVQRVDHLAEDRVELIVAERGMNFRAEGFLLLFPVHASQREEGVVVVEDAGELTQSQGAQYRERDRGQSGVGRSTASITTTSIGSVPASSLSPSCS